MHDELHCCAVKVIEAQAKQQGVDGFKDLKEPRVQAQILISYCFKTIITLSEMDEPLLLTRETCCVHQESVILSTRTNHESRLVPQPFRGANEAF